MKEELYKRYMLRSKSIKDWNKRREEIKNKVIWGSAIFNYDTRVKRWNSIAFNIDARGLVKYAKSLHGWK
jgi:hypothetical protein